MNSSKYKLYWYDGPIILKDGRVHDRDFHCETRAKSEKQALNNIAYQYYKRFAVRGYAQKEYLNYEIDKDQVTEENSILEKKANDYVQLALF